MVCGFGTKVIMFLRVWVLFCVGYNIITLITIQDGGNIYCISFVNMPHVFILNDVGVIIL